MSGVTKTQHAAKAPSAIGRRRVQPQAAAPRGAPAAAERARWPWARQWEFWLAVGLGAFLRLWHLSYSLFLTDQPKYMNLARASVLHGAIPITGLAFTFHQQSQ